MDRLSLALREIESALLGEPLDLEEKDRLQKKFLRIFAAIRARRLNDELTDEELDDWITEEYNRNEISRDPLNP